MRSRTIRCFTALSTVVAFAVIEPTTTRATRRRSSRVRIASPERTRRVK